MEEVRQQIEGRFKTIGAWCEVALNPQHDWTDEELATFLDAIADVSMYGRKYRGRLLSVRDDLEEFGIHQREVEAASDP